MGKQVKILNESGLPTCNFIKFTDLQGNFKELSRQNYEKLKESILTYGFSFPIFVWQNDSTLYTADGTQRLRVLKKLSEDGYFIPEIPYCKIYAKDKKDAIERLLLFNSNFGKVTEEGLYELAAKNEINLEQFITKIELPEINVKQFVSSYYRDITGEVNPEDKTDSPVYITCPSCKFKWEAGKV